MARHEPSPAGGEWQSFALWFPFVACRRCGCRMITKVGRTTPMLICTDCGLPIDQRQTATLDRQRLSSAVVLMVMALVAGSMVLLASVNEMRRAGSLDEASGSPAEASGEEGKEDERRLMEPSDLLDGTQRSGERARQPQLPGRTSFQPGRASAPSGGVFSGTGSGRDAAAPAAAPPRPASAAPAAPGR